VGALRSTSIITMSRARIFVLRARRRSQVRRAAAAWRRENHSGIVPIMHNMRSFYTEDPDGVPVEFLQYTP
jgi:hypothetical protein